MSADFAELRQSLAAEFAIPDEHHDLLSATDPDALRSQAEKIAALVAAQGPPPPPLFAANPGQGQGQGGGSSTDTEYDRFYPSTNSYQR